MSRFTSKALFVTALVMLVPLAAVADHKLTMTVSTTAYEVQGTQIPASEKTAVYWIGDDHARTDQADTASFIIFGDERPMVMINHREKTYMEVPKGALSDLIAQKAGNDSTAMAQAQSIMDMMRVKVKVTPTDETKKIGEYNCKKYVQEIEIAMTTSSTDVWTTEDLGIDNEMIKKAAHAMKAFLPGFDECIGELEKIKGVTVESTTSGTYMGGVQMSTTTRLSKVEELDPPAGTYEIPEGYTKSEVTLPGL